MICDGAAHKAVWSTKGDSGTKFCLLCANATGHRPTLEQQQTMPEPLPDDELFIDTSCTTYSQLRLVSDQEILASYRRLAGRVGTCSKKEFQKWEQAIGVTFTKKALLTNEALLERSLLRPCSTFCHDYMHGVFQGTAVVVLHRVLQDVSEHLDVWQFLHGYMDHFIFPAAWKMTPFEGFVRREASNQGQKHPEVFLHGLGVCGHIRTHQAVCPFGAGASKHMSGSMQSISCHGLLRRPSP